VRDYDGDLRLAHDALPGGERLEDLLAAYRHSFVIFNVKCDGLESRVMALAERYGDNVPGLLGQSESGRALQAVGLGDDLEFCAQLSMFDIVPVLRDGVVLLDQR